MTLRDIRPSALLFFLLILSGEMMPDSTGEPKSTTWPAATAKIVTSLITILPQIAWPIVATFAIIYFHRPIYSAAEAISWQIGMGGATVEVQGFGITLPKSSIPAPPEEVKDVLPYFDSEMISFYDSKHRWRQHNRYMHPDNNNITEELKKYQLMTFTPEKVSQSDGKTCDGVKYRYTKTYDAIREYLLKILTSVKFT